jgi:hypothetical protein
MFAAGDTVNIEKSSHPNIVWLRARYGIGPHTVKSVEEGYLRIEFELNNEHLLWPSAVEKVAGVIDLNVSLKDAYDRNKERDWCLRCGKRTIRVRIGAGFQFCPCTDPSWSGGWPT